MADFTLADDIYVVGDSHVRTFGYRNNTVPCFLGPGKTLLLNDERTTSVTIQTVLAFINRLPSNSNLILLIGEPSLRYFLENSDSTIYDASFVSDFCKNLRRLSSAICERGFNVVVLPPVPRRDPSYAQLWLPVVSQLHSSGIPSADIFERIVEEDGQLKSAYVGDFIHSNQRLADHVFKMLGVASNPSSSIWAWTYQYECAGARVWGGVPIDTLIYDGTKARDWNKLLAKTRDAELAVGYLKGLIRILGHTCINRASVLESPEGFFSRMLGITNIRVIDAKDTEASIRFRRAAILDSLYMQKRLCFNEANPYSLTIFVGEDRFKLRDISIRFMRDKNKCNTKLSDFVFASVRISVETPSHSLFLRSVIRTFSLGFKLFIKLRRGLR